MHLLLEAGLGFPLDDVHGGLDHHRPAVELFGDEMHAAAMLCNAIGKRLGVGVQSLVGRQQRRVDIEHPPQVALHEARSQDAHEAGQHDQVGLMAIDDLDQAPS
ncbi:hypothetical protein Q427_10975 [Halomonas sp. BC04]|nr:hypothetical protein Q427_10975 [Halomonas sp. BC04]